MHPLRDIAGSLPVSALGKLDQIEERYAALERELQDPLVLGDHRKVRQLTIERAAIEPTAVGCRELRAMAAEIGELEQATRGTDRELAQMAQEELPPLRQRAQELLRRVVSELVHSDDRAVGSVIMELRAGAGGDEAALWTRDLLEMYTRLAARRGWNVETLDVSTEGGAGGVRSAVLSIKGSGVWSDLAFEAGVHSVKRVPATEAQGRIHTSTATVAVLPEPESIDIKVDWASDVEEFATTSQGPGGQNVNKVATAVQITHKPTGIIIRMQESKSQHQNRERARRLLLARLYELEQQKRRSERSAARKSQVGSGDRSEKIRTYRYKEAIAVDERLPGQYALRDLLAGDMDTLVSDLRNQETARRLAEL